MGRRESAKAARRRIMCWGVRARWGGGGGEMEGGCVGGTEKGGVVGGDGGGAWGGGVSQISTGRSIARPTHNTHNCAFCVRLLHVASFHRPYAFAFYISHYHCTRTAESLNSRCFRSQPSRIASASNDPMRFRMNPYASSSPRSLSFTYFLTV